MFESLASCFCALLSDEGVKIARGGYITQPGEEYQYGLLGESDAIRGDLVFLLKPSQIPGFSWTALPTTPDAQKAFDDFRADPKNGELLGYFR